MDYMKEYRRLVGEQATLALASLNGDAPNVRIVNFVHDPERDGRLFFATFANNPKTREFAKNDRVAFTTIPVTGNGHVRAGQARVVRSRLKIRDLAAAFIARIPDYAETIEQVGDRLRVYEIVFSEAVVTLDFLHAGKVRLRDPG